ncbi:hypothetical protein [Priestia megaterium]|uniref:hypothetical protein n=1 Tax=Priestia megaterium TaxID=1404 RepID=UPI003CF2353A
MKEGNRRLTYDIPGGLHKELRFLAVDHDTGVMKYVKGLLEEHLKKVRKVKKEHFLCKESTLDKFHFIMTKYFFILNILGSSFFICLV